MRKRFWMFMLVAVAPMALVTTAADSSPAATPPANTNVSHIVEPHDAKAYLVGRESLASKAGPMADTCGRGNPMNAVREPDGWLIGWRNCWGDNGLSVAPVWFNGIGNTYVNARNGLGGNLCQYIPNDGLVHWWFIVDDDLPPEPTNYTSVVYCLAF
jgi:hypothetical protein